MTSLLLAAALAQAVTPELRQHVEAGLKARAAGDLDTAVREFQRVTELAPDLAASHVNLGGVYLEKKDYVRATPSLRRALALNNELPGAHQMLGTALLAQGAAAEAIPHLEKAQAIDLLGIALVEAGRARDAIDRLEAALLRRPGDPDLLYYLIQAHGSLSKTLFDRLRSQPGARTEQLLGEAAAASGQPAEAEKHFKAAIAARPELRGVHLALGELHLAAGAFALAEKEFREEAAMSPASALAAYKHGIALANLGQQQAAASEFGRANSLRPDMPEAALELGKALAAIDKTQDAITALQAVIRLEPESALAEAAYLQLSQIYRKLGLAAEARKATESLQTLRKRRKP